MCILFSISGNDLARVLRWGPGYTGAEDLMSLLHDIIDAEDIQLDRYGHQSKIHVQLWKLCPWVDLVVIQSDVWEDLQSSKTQIRSFIFMLWEMCQTFACIYGYIISLVSIKAKRWGKERLSYSLLSWVSSFLWLPEDWGGTKSKLDSSLHCMNVLTRITIFDAV